MWIGFCLFVLGTMPPSFQVEQSGQEILIPIGHLPANAKLFEVAPHQDPTTTLGKQIVLPPGTASPLTPNGDCPKTAASRAYRCKCLTMLWILAFITPPSTST